MDGACFAVGVVAREGSFQGDKGTRAKVGVCKDLAEVYYNLDTLADLQYCPWNLCYTIHIFLYLCCDYIIINVTKYDVSYLRR